MGFLFIVRTHGGLNDQRGYGSQKLGQGSFLTKKGINIKTFDLSQMLMAYTCNLSFLGT
jgi:hypothetical protein